MIKTFVGRVLDVETNAPVIAARIYTDALPSGGVQTDESGEFHLAADDSTLSDWYHVDATAQGYGDVVQQLGGLQGDIFIYKTTASVVAKAKAAIKNSALGIAVTSIAILIILFIAKKYIPQ